MRLILSVLAATLTLSTTPALAQHAESNRMNRRPISTDLRDTMAQYQYDMRAFDQASRRLETPYPQRRTYRPVQRQQQSQRVVIIQQQDPYPIQASTRSRIRDRRSWRQPCYEHRHSHRRHSPYRQSHKRRW